MGNQDKTSNIDARGHGKGVYGSWRGVVKLRNIYRIRSYGGGVLQNRADTYFMNGKYGNCDNRVVC
jgi:hypothetical protein